MKPTTTAPPPALADLPTDGPLPVALAEAAHQALDGATDQPDSRPTSIPQIFAAELRPGLDGGPVPWIGLDLNDDVDLDTPERTRAAAKQAAVFAARLNALAEEQARQAPTPGLVQLTAPGADRALLGAELYTWDDGNGPVTTLSLYSETGVDLDLAETDQFIAGLIKFIPKVQRLRDRLASIEQPQSATPADTAPVLAAVAALVEQAIHTAQAARPDAWAGHVLDQVHRAVNQAAAPHRSAAGGWDDPLKAYSDLAFGTAVDAMAEALRASSDPTQTLRALRAALELTAEEDA
ncbi:hypothetical protein RKE29_02195 [Streptomyces sp. B1866]|uniref:hypothetical protein n=1 Tax=Streptomyces sp. B1866 TaxID=3075431 RepID=UPI00288CC8AB|nr:hypothetical protein [Streptomyces sp. B1866]MDT3395472.1 hypothetical protein [Streptomyces sp. B1866]